MIPYYSPHFGLIDLLRTLTCSNSEDRLRDYFQNLTGKKHILFTTSCRSALYLAYQSINRKGVVHTSPLTCQVALIPIVASGNKIHFHDVKSDDWTIDPTTIQQSITNESIAIQAIHFGGFPCDMISLKKIAEDNGLLLIEDCAQGFGSKFRGVNAGTFGDVSCFTLTKNAFGLGGGVLATDNVAIYNKAKKLQMEFPKVSNLIIIYRIVIAVISTIRGPKYIEFLYRYLISKKKGLAETEESKHMVQLGKEMKQPPSIYIQSVTSRISKIKRLNDEGRMNAIQIVSELNKYGYTVQQNTLSESSYVKLFAANPEQHALRIIKQLNDTCIEAMHLEHRYGCYFQRRVIENELFMSEKTGMLTKYNDLHDRLISLPIDKHIELIIQYLRIVPNSTQKGL